MVVQDNVFNHSRIATVVVCALTTNLRRAKEPGNVLLDAGEGNLPKQSVAVVSQIASVDKTRLGARIGALSGERVDQIVAGLRFQQVSFFTEHPADPRVRVIESAVDLNQALEIRARVFIQERACLPNWSAMPTTRAAPICSRRSVRNPSRRRATGRRPRDTSSSASAVLREHRGRGIGSALVRYLCAAVPGEAIYLHAQLSALPFWERLGFMAEGEPFEEAGIEHRAMRLRAR